MLQYLHALAQFVFAVDIQRAAQGGHFFRQQLFAYGFDGIITEYLVMYRYGGRILAIDQRFT